MHTIYCHSILLGRLWECEAKGQANGSIPFLYLVILDGEERVQIPSLPPLQPLDKPIFLLKAMRRQKEQVSLENAFMVDNMVSLTYCLGKKNSWREVSHLGQSHKLSESGAIPERSNHVLERNAVSLMYIVMF